MGFDRDDVFRAIVAVGPWVVLGQLVIGAVEMAIGRPDLAFVFWLGSLSGATAIQVSKKRRK